MAPKEYRGSSFVGLLRSEHPELVPRFEGRGGPSMELVHGTTICAMEFKGGVLLGGDRRATMGGSVIMNEEVVKVFKVDDFSAIAIAGAFGPSVKLAKLFQVELEHYEKIEGTTLTLEGKANKLGLMIEANLPAAMQGLVIMPLYVGYDLPGKEGHIFEYDVTGGIFRKTRNERFATSGSGGDRARATFEHFWRPDLDRDAAVELLCRGLSFASKRDGATGPGNYIVMSATENGVEIMRGDA